MSYFSLPFFSIRTRLKFLNASLLSIFLQKFVKIKETQSNAFFILRNVEEVCVCVCVCVSVSVCLWEVGGGEGGRCYPLIAFRTHEDSRSYSLIFDQCCILFDGVYCES